MQEHYSTDTPPHLQYSWPKKPTPHSKSHGRLILAQFWLELTEDEQHNRVQAYRQAVRYIDQRPHLGFKSGSFMNEEFEHVRDAPRIDIVVHEGVAFDLP